MKENEEIEAVVSDVDNNGTKTFEVKKQKTYKRKDIITTAIIAFLVGAIIATGGFAISKALSKGKGNKDFRTNGIHRNIEEKNINNEQNRSSNKMNNSNANKKNNRQNIPNINNNSKNNNQNNQNPPSLPNNEQQPNNSNSSQNVPNNNQNSTSNKS